MNINWTDPPWRFYNKGQGHSNRKLYRIIRIIRKVTEHLKKGAMEVEYNYLSKQCGLKVSNLCMGTFTFGEDKLLNSPNQCDEALAHQLLDRFEESGGSFIDTANIYASGQSESFIGAWMHKRQNRDEMVVATKCGMMTGKGPNSTGLSRKHIMTSIEESLKRLQTDYIDIYQIHIWDDASPLKEVLSTLNDLVRTGKVRYVGGSNLKGWQLQKILDLNQSMGFGQWVSLQQQYNLIDRWSELEVFDVCHREGLGIMPYSPLKYGLLTDRVKKDSPLPEGTRIATLQARPFESYSVDEYLKDPNFWELLDSVETISESHGKTISQVALRWLLQKQGVTSVIIGAKSLQQLNSNLGAGKGWYLTSEQMDTLDTLSSLKRIYPYAEFDQDRKRCLFAEH